MIHYHLGHLNSLPLYTQRSALPFPTPAVHEVKRIEIPKCTPHLILIYSINISNFMTTCMTRHWSPQASIALALVLRLRHSSNLALLSLLQFKITLATCCELLIGKSNTSVLLKMSRMHIDPFG